MSRRLSVLAVGLLGVASAITITVAANAATGCEVTYTEVGRWGGGFQGNVTVRNAGDRLTGWKVGLTFPSADQRTTQSWQAAFTQSGRTVTFANAGWNGTVDRSATISFGFIGTFTRVNPAPTGFSLNGIACSGGGDASGGGAPPATNPTNSTPAGGTAPRPTRPSSTPTSGSGQSARTRFSTLPPGSVLPSGAQCAARVRATPIPENKAGNAVANRTTGHPVSGSTGHQTRVDGNFTGTTAQILRWAACKWGLDEDLVKAQAAIESWWRMDTKGDWGTDPGRCPPGHGLGADGKKGSCPESFGLIQIRFPYNVAAFPGAVTSSAFNADYAYANWRSCYEGQWTWLNTVERGLEYRAGDALGCMGVWFSGRWHTAAADGYVARVQDYLTRRIWETPNFRQP